jgi:hypothetical protein
MICTGGFGEDLAFTYVDPSKFKKFMLQPMTTMEGMGFVYMSGSHGFIPI